MEIIFEIRTEIRGCIKLEELQYQLKIYKISRFDKERYEGVKNFFYFNSFQKNRLWGQKINLVGSSKKVNFWSSDLSVFIGA